MGRLKWYHILSIILGILAVVILSLFAAGVFDGTVPPDSEDSELPVINHFNADPDEVTANDDAVLCWSVSGALTVAIEPDIGNVALSGDLSVRPHENTTYILTASNEEGSVTATVQVIGYDGPSPSTEGEIDEIINIGSHSLHLYCLGYGNLTVVIDVGIGDSYTNWHDIQEQIAQETQVCAYDRAGYGLSEPGPMPRTSQQVVEELKTLLEKAGIVGPYVLVGHSLGGLNMQIFANRYPELVAGIVLLDPPPLDWITGQGFPELRQLAEQDTAALLAAAEQARQASDPIERAKADYYETLASEHAMMFEFSEEAAAIMSFGDTPLIVLASGVPNPQFGESAEAFQQFWIEQSQALASKSTYGTCIVVEESTHFLYADVPTLVLDSILQVVGEAQK